MISACFDQEPWMPGEWQEQVYILAAGVRLPDHHRGFSVDQHRGMADILARCFSQLFRLEHLKMTKTSGQNVDESCFL